MRSRSRYLGALALALVLALTACGDDGAAPAQETLAGVIDSIEPPEGDIQSFTLVRPGEDPMTILVDPEIDYGFDLQHLHEHHASADPVRVTLDDRDGRLYATAIEDV
ncbi:MAG TPA: hypothetical protein VJ927_11660 [Actinomycetota bacterium]|nr:hypothetical protein [Actinomycetota bacterium]